MSVKRFSILMAAVFAVVFMLVLLSGCREGGSSGEEDVAAPAGKIVVRDDSGYELILDKPPQRIISLAPSNTEILFALGVGERVVGVTTYCDYPEEAKEKARIGDLQGNTEEIVALQPDLVIAKWTLNKNMVDRLRKLNIPVLCVEPESFEGVYRAIAMIAKVTGTDEVGEKIIADMKKKIAEVQEKIAGIPEERRVRVFIEVGTDPLFTAGSKTFVDELVRLAGGINVASEIEGYQMYSSEAVIEKNPDVILAPDSYYIDVEQVIKERAGWEQIKAVREGRVITKIDPNLINRPGPRSAQAVELVAEAFYPDLFN